MALADRFFPAFLVMLDKLAERNYFAEHAGATCDGGAVHWSAPRVRRELVLHVGKLEWPFEEDDLGHPIVEHVTDDEVIQYVEGFFQFVSKPIETWWHDFGRHEHGEKYDYAVGRYDYTVAVNRIHRRFQTGLWLDGGRMRGTRGSRVLNPRLVDRLPTGGDPHLEQLLGMALAEYQSTDPSRRWTGLRHLADAYERVKTLSKPGKGNKTQSIAALVRTMTPDAQLAEHLNGMMRALTDVSNTHTIRHHEVGTVEIVNEPELIEYLFYSYYNVVRFALLRLHGNDEME